jgi:hypothetical protein
LADITPAWPARSITQSSSVVKRLPNRALVRAASNRRWRTTRSAEARLLDQCGDHLDERLGEPTVPVKQHDRRSAAALEQRGGDAANVDTSGGDRDAFDQTSGEPVGRRVGSAGRPPVHGSIRRSG